MQLSMINLLTWSSTRFLGWENHIRMDSIMPYLRFINRNNQNLFDTVTESGMRWDLRSSGRLSWNWRRNIRNNLKHNFHGSPRLILNRLKWWACVTRRRERELSLIQARNSSEFTFQFHLSLCGRVACHIFFLLIVAKTIFMTRPLPEKGSS